MANSIGSGLGGNIVSVSFINQPFPNGGGSQGTTEQPTTSTSSTTLEPTTTIFCEPVPVNGYFPLYSTEQCAVQAGNGTFHSHTLNGVTWYMPNGVEYWHGNYTTTSTSTTGEPTTSTSSTTEEPTTSTSTTLEPEYLNQDGFAGFRVNQFFNRDGELWSLGTNDENTFAELGFGFGVNPSDQGDPSQTSMSDVEFIAGGGNRLYVIKDDGSVWAVGRNTNGELGDGTQETAFTFIKIFDAVDKNYSTTTSTSSTTTSTSTTEEPTTSTSTTSSTTTSTSTTEEPTTSTSTTSSTTTSTSTTEEPTTSTSTTEEPTTSTSTTQEPTTTLDPLYWSPSNSSEIVGWWDASDSSTITTSGSEVTQWRDKSGNNLHLAPVLGETAPITNSIQQNSLNVLDFNGDCLENNNFSHDISNPIYIAFLVELDSLVTDQYFLWAGTDNSSNRSAIRKRANGLVEVFGKLATDGANTFVPFGALTRGVFHILVAKIHGSNAVSYLNGSQIQTGNSGVHNLNTFNLGHAEDEAQKFTGKFAEVTAFTDGNDRQKIEGYLAHKWGLAGNLPNDHPYKTSEPV